MYHKEFEQAVARSKSFGLATPNVEYSSGRYLTEDRMAEFPHALRDAVGEIGIEEVVAQCLAIHYRLREPVEKIFGCNSYFTIGYVETVCQLMFYQSEEDLRSMLHNGIHGSSLKLHAWLTLPSMEILDISLPTSYAFLNNLKDGVGGVIAEHPDSLKQGMKYHPMLVGDDFLRKTGALVEFGI